MHARAKKRSVAGQWVMVLLSVVDSRVMVGDVSSRQDEGRTMRATVRVPLTVVTADVNARSERG
jgi:hypothetical protein